MSTREQIYERLSKVLDPEIGQPITDLGMVADYRVVGDRVKVRVKLTVRGCPLQARIQEEVTQAMSGLEGIRGVDVELDVMTDQEREALAQRLRPELKQRYSSVTEPNSSVRVVIVGSGKGGVGKSTVTVNLAAALHGLGKKVGVLDADVYGFSVPRMIGAKQQPVVLGDGLIMPVDVRGLKVISMGMLVGEDTPVIWRGPMLTKLLDQFLGDVVWGDLDYLVIDAPPGTGDIAITLVQKLPAAKVVLVTTPQVAATRVAGRVAQMAKRVGQDVLGVVENMSYFRCSHGEVSEIFGSGGGEALGIETGSPLLGQLPLERQLIDQGDEGVPIVWASPEDEASLVFRRIAQQVDESALWRKLAHA